MSLIFPTSVVTANVDMIIGFWLATKRCLTAFASRDQAPLDHVWLLAFTWVTVEEPKLSYQNMAI